MVAGRAGRRRRAMEARPSQLVRWLFAILWFFLLLRAPAVLALPAPGPLNFIAPSPAQSSLVTSGSISVKLDATCTFDPNSLAVTLNGTTIPASQFLPFSACTNGRITSQTAT